MRQDDDMATANIEIPDVEITNAWTIDLGLNTNMKILIIDDEPVNVALLEDMLRESGYTQIKSIMDSSLALDSCKAFEPDLILLDLIMPDPNGFAILEFLRANSNEIFLPIVILTADITEAAKRHALHSGATDFLHKPLNQTEVLLRIRNLLETRRIHQQLVSHYLAALRNEGDFLVTEGATAQKSSKATPAHVTRWRLSKISVSSEPYAVL